VVVLSISSLCLLFRCFSIFLISFLFTSLIYYLFPHDHYDLHPCFQTSSIIYFSMKKYEIVAPHTVMRITPEARCLDHTPNKRVGEVVAHLRAVRI
jgi:hypothetical protein